MATEPHKTCPPTPRKAPRRHDVLVIPQFAVTSFDIECIGKISPDNTKQIMLDSDFLDKKVVQIQDTNLVVYIGQPINNCSDKTYQASISQNGQIIFANCQLKTRHITPSISNYYDGNASLQRIHTFSVTNSSGERIDFQKPLTNEAVVEHKRFKSANAFNTANAGYQWREKPVPISLMFKQASPERSASSDRTELNTLSIN